MLSISAIIPTLDEAQCIDAVLHDLGALDVLERIVVDGGSTDSTCALAKHHLHVQLRRSAQGRGPQQDAGAAAATGDVLWFVHADARVPSDAVDRIRETLADPTVVAGAFRRRTQPESDSWIRPLLPLADWRSGITRHPYGDQAIFVRRDAFFGVGGFRGLLQMEDVDLCRRLGTCGRIAIVDAAVVTSARRFEAAPFRTTVKMLTLPLLYRLGAPTSLLHRAYSSGAAK